MLPAPRTSPHHRFPIDRQRGVASAALAAREKASCLSLQPPNSRPVRLQTFVAAQCSPQCRCSLTARCGEPAGCQSLLLGSAVWYAALQLAVVCDHQMLRSEIRSRVLRALLSFSFRPGRGTRASLSFSCGGFLSLPSYSLVSQFGDIARGLARGERRGIGRIWHCSFLTRLFWQLHFFGPECVRVVRGEGQGRSSHEGKRCRWLREVLNVRILKHGVH